MYCTACILQLVLKYIIYIYTVCLLTCIDFDFDLLLPSVCKLDVAI